MYNNRDKLLGWIQADLVNSDNLEQLVTSADARPNPDQWLLFAKQTLLWLAVICLGAGVIFFFAYNWQALTRMHRFALVEVAVLLSSIAFLRFSTNLHARKALLMGLALLTGSLLALVGQTYQTGADHWQLFAVWALFITPWALCVNSSVIWIFWAILINTTLLLYIELTQEFLWFYMHSSDTSLLLLCAINSILLAAFEIHARYFLADVKKASANRYIQQALIAAACLFITIWAVVSTNDKHVFQTLSIYLCWLIVISLIYRFLIKDLFCFALCSLSLLVISTYQLVRLIDNSNLEALFFVSAAYILGASTVIGFYLKKLNYLFNLSTDEQKESNNG
jgi:uncharacterized membrane protein